MQKKAIECHTIVSDYNDRYLYDVHGELLSKVEGENPDARVLFFDKTETSPICNPAAARTLPLECSATHQRSWFQLAYSDTLRDPETKPLAP